MSDQERNELKRRLEAEGCVVFDSVQAYTDDVMGIINRGFEQSQGPQACREEVTAH